MASTSSMGRKMNIEGDRVRFTVAISGLQRKPILKDFLNVYGQIADNRGKGDYLEQILTLGFLRLRDHYESGMSPEVIAQMGMDYTNGNNPHVFSQPARTRSPDPGMSGLQLDDRPPIPETTKSSVSRLLGKQLGKQ